VENSNLPKFERGNWPANAHVLKCWPEFFEAIAAGLKRHDLRRADDREFQVGETVLLQEFDPHSAKHTGREQIVEITYVTAADRPCALSERGLYPEYCILSIRPIGEIAYRNS
jgi:hypothetical protein